MAINDSQKVDYLWKKLGYGVSKTDTIEFKRAYNESISSPLLLRGDKVWREAGDIPAVKPSTTSGVVELYNGIECTEDITATARRTWKTDVTDWIPPEFGATYLVKVYVATAGSTTPTTSGTQLLAAGSGNDDEWFFDYQSGVLHFIGANLPSDVTTGKSIFIVGATYVGDFGLGSLISDTPSLEGNLNLSGYAIITNSNGDLILDPDGTGAIDVSNSNIINLADPVNLQDAATKNYVDDYFANFNDDRIVSGNTNVIATTNDITFTINNTGVLSVSSTGIGPYTANDTFVIETNSAVQLAKGTTAQRPVSATAGDTRYNTTNNQLEYYNGLSWVSLTAVSSASQAIIPDGSTTTFTLSETATAETIIVTINGVVQHIGRYTVSGTNITFAETPLTSDIIDIRYLASQVNKENNYRDDLTAAPTSATSGNEGDYWISSGGVMYMHNGSNWYSFTGNLVS